jgi:hypothetical protein
MRRPAVLVAVLVVATPVGAEGPAVTVAAVAGRAEWRAATDARWQPARPGEDLAVAARLRTAANTRLRVLLRDGSVLVLGADGEIELPAGAGPPPTLRLARGTARVVQGGGADGLAVRTDAAVVSTRDGGFVARADDATGITRVLGLFGTTEVRAEGTSLTLAPDGEAVVARGGALLVEPAAAARTALLDATDLPDGGHVPEGEAGAPLPPALQHLRLLPPDGDPFDRSTTDIIDILGPESVLDVPLGPDRGVGFGPGSEMPCSEFPRPRTCPPPGSGGGPGRRRSPGGPRPPVIRAR